MMKWVLFLGLGAATLLSVLLVVRNTQSTPSPKENEAQPNGEEAPTPVAVVELFTSEGCSSCPPADNLLGEIVKDAQKQKQHVYCLAFHVDYWNYLGWRDPYSDAAFSRRQQEYVKALKTDQVYTPQMVVNGSKEFLGSDRTGASKEIDTALKQPIRTAVKLNQEVKKTPNTLVLGYEVSHAPKGSVLNVAVVERGLVSQVKHGENGGRTLRHENVVRAFETIRLGDAEKGTVKIQLPADLVRKNCSAIAYVQDGETWAVFGATAIELQQTNAR